MLYFKGWLNVSTEVQESSSFNGARWIASLVLVAGAVYANHYFGQNESTSLLIHVAVVVALSIAAFVVAATTSKGKQAMEFARESRMEVRKVVWPTRQESIQTTLIILVFVAVISLFLWGTDALLAWVVNSIMSL